MITIILLLIGAGLTFFTAFHSYNEKHKDFRNGNSSSKSYKTVFFFALLGILVSLGSNINTYIEKENGSKRAKALSDSLFSLNNKAYKLQEVNTSLLKEQKNYSDKIISTQEKLITANENIGSLQSKLYTNLSGEGNTPVLIVAPITSTNEHYILQLSLKNNSKNPLRGIKINVVDSYSIIEDVVKENDDSLNTGFEATLNITKKTYNDFAKTWTKEINIGVLPSQYIETFYYPQIPKKLNKFSYTLKIQWDNGFYFCTIRGKKEGGNQWPKLTLTSVWTQKGETKSSEFVKVINIKD